MGVYVGFGPGRGPPPGPDWRNGEHGHARHSIKGSTMATICIADDDITSRHTLRAIVTGEGHEVVEASDGAEALRAVNESRVDLLLTDIFMPGIEGLEVIRILRESHPGLPVIAFTTGSTFTAYETLNWARSYGVSGALTKPFSREDILGEVRKILPRA